MAHQRISVFKGAVMLLLALLGSLAQLGPSQAAAITWNSSVQVPSNSCKTMNPPQTYPCLDISSSTANDQLGRTWLAFAEKFQGFNGSAGRLDIYYRLWNGTSWGKKQQVTTDINQDQNPSITSLLNGTMMIAWSSNRTGTYQLFYRFYSGLATTPFATSNEIRLTNSLHNDTQPSIVQDRNGRMWVVWNRNSAVYYKYFQGASWSSDFLLPPAVSSIGERSPAIMQRKDGRVIVAWATVPVGIGNANILYSTTDATLRILPSLGINSTGWSIPVSPLTTNAVTDDKPALTQARDGTLLVFWQRFTSSNVPNIFWTSSADNGGSWSAPAAIAPNLSEQYDVAAMQMSDKRVWVFWDQLGLNSTQIWDETSNFITGIHDVGLTTLSSSSYFFRSADSINISIGVTNYGDFQENSTLTVQLNATGVAPVVKKISLTLAAGQKLPLQFSWNSTQPYWGFWGRYNLTATLTSVPGEVLINQGDNQLSAGLVRISPLGDLDRNGRVDIIDAARLAFAFGSTGPPFSPPSQLWDPEADIDHNGVVNIVDAATLAFYFGDSV